MRKNRKRKRILFYIGYVLVFIGILILLLNFILATGFKEDLFRQLAKSKEYREASVMYGDNLIDEINNLLIFFSIMWLVIIVLSILALIAINRDEKNWFYFLMIGLLAFFTFKFEVGILMLISSFLFWIEKNKNENKRK